MRIKNKHLPSLFNSKIEKKHLEKKKQFAKARQCHIWSQPDPDAQVL